MWNPGRVPEFHWVPTTRATPWGSPNQQKYQENTGFKASRCRFGGQMRPGRRLGPRRSQPKILKGETFLKDPGLPERFPFAHRRLD